MSRLSVLILTKNEEKNIGECLDSISFADEKIVVDAESVDETVEVAKNSGAKVFIHHFKDFADQRDFALSKATGEWVLYVDADERVTDPLRENIKYQIDAIAPQAVDRYSRRMSGSNIKYKNIVAYKIQRKNFYLGNHEWPYIEKLERLFKKKALKGWYGELHETPIIKGEIGELDGFLLHYTHQDLSSMVKKTIEWSEIEANLRLRAGHPKMTWWRFPRVMLSEFLNYYVRQGGFRVGTVGLIESLYQAFSIFITYARLWELQHEKKNL